MGGVLWVPHHRTWATSTILVIPNWDGDAVQKRECLLSYSVETYCLLLIVLPRPSVCLRPGVYYSNSPVCPRRVIETSVYSKPACIRENTVLHCTANCVHHLRVEEHQEWFYCGHWMLVLFNFPQFRQASCSPQIRMGEKIIMYHLTHTALFSLTYTALVSWECWTITWGGACCLGT